MEDLQKKSEETLSIYRENLDDIKKEYKLEYDFESIEPFLSVFDEVPLKEREKIIEYLVFMIWGYTDRKKKGTQKKSISDLKNKVIKYQESLRELHNSDVVNEVVFRNGRNYSYDGEYDYDEDFDIDSVLWHLSLPLQKNYLTNIELLKEIEEFEFINKYFKDEGLPPNLKNKFMSAIGFKLIDPLKFIDAYRPNKEHIKNTLYTYAEKFNLKKYEIKQLIDCI